MLLWLDMLFDLIYSTMIELYSYNRECTLFLINYAVWPSGNLNTKQIFLFSISFLFDILKWKDAQNSGNTPIFYDFIPKIQKIRGFLCNFKKSYLFLFS